MQEWTQDNTVILVGKWGKSDRREGEEVLGQIMEALGFVLTVIGGVWKILNKIRVRVQ